MSNDVRDANQMLSTEQAAALLGLRPCTLAAWREDGSQPQLVFFKLGKAVRYRYADLVAFLETRRASSTLAARQLAPATPLPIAPPPIRSERPSMRRRTQRRDEHDQQSLF